MKKNRWRKLYAAHAQFICPYCLQQFPLSCATIEHEPPRSRQRVLGASRTLLACEKCNNQKGALTADEYNLWKKTTDYQTWVRLERIRNGNTKGV